LYLGDQLKKINIVSFTILLLFARRAYVTYKKIKKEDVRSELKVLDGIYNWNQTEAQIHLLYCSNGFL
jgi:hypothetical protein